jgi:UDPglucose--hexose-1-phosphate uridylyltransferase
MEIRLNPITREPIIIATKRAARPHFGAGRSVHPPLDKSRPKVAKKVDPFASGNEQSTGKELWAIGPENRRPNASGWQVRIIPNKFPITNHHEVVIYSPHSTKDLDRLSRRHVQLIIDGYLQRTKAHEPKGNVLIFCNHGPQAGATITHPHAQIIVFPTEPPQIQREVEAAEAYFAKQGNCVYCHQLDNEIRLKKRVVWQNDEFVLLCPEGSGWPYELLLMPKTHQPNFGNLRAPQAAALAEALQLMVRLYNRVLEKPDYNYWIHSVKGRFFHWHVEMVPRTKTLAGVELGGGIMVNDRITPEDAAAQFRAAL